jgi:hypothetical protein
VQVAQLTADLVVPPPLLDLCARRIFNEVKGISPLVRGAAGWVMKLDASPGRLPACRPY